MVVVAVVVMGVGGDVEAGPVGSSLSFGPFGCFE